MSLMTYVNETWEQGREKSCPNRVKPVTSLRTRYSVLAGGMAAGLCGGIFMGLFEMLVAFLKGNSTLTPFYLIDDVLRGFITFVVGQSGAALIGVAVHLFVSAVFGGVFSLLIRVFADEDSTPDAFFGGLAYGVFLWGFVNYSFLLLWLNPVIGMREPLTPENFFFAHIVYGASLALKPTLTRLIRGGKQLEREFLENEKERAKAAA